MSLTDKPALSAKQSQILEYIKQCILSKGYPPSVREICEAVGLSSTSSVHSQLNTLEKKGYIRRELGKKMIIRYSPELIFISDKNIEYGVHIAKVLADAARTGENGHGRDETES